MASQGKQSNCYILNNIPEIYDLCSVWGALYLPLCLPLPHPSWHILPPPGAMERFPLPVAIFAECVKNVAKNFNALSRCGRQMEMENGMEKMTNDYGA